MSKKHNTAYEGKSEFVLFPLYGPKTTKVTLFPADT